LARVPHSFLLILLLTPPRILLWLLIPLTPYAYLSSLTRALLSSTVDCTSPARSSLDWYLIPDKPFRGSSSRSVFSSSRSVLFFFSPPANFLIQFGLVRFVSSSQ
jgi:hypothetical protein